MTTPASVPVPAPGPGGREPVAVTVLGGPTAILELGGVRLLTDPTFDPPGTYPIGERVLTKTQPSAWAPDEVGPVAAVLLSHDQHPDNLDRSGREFLGRVPAVLTTRSAAGRLGASARALPPWTSVKLTAAGRAGAGRDRGARPARSRRHRAPDR